MVYFFEQGALEMRDKCVGDAMISIDDVFMLDKNAKLDRKTMSLVSIDSNLVFLKIPKATNFCLSKCIFGYFTSGFNL